MSELILIFFAGVLALLYGLNALLQAIRRAPKLGRVALYLAALVLGLVLTALIRLAGAEQAEPLAQPAVLGLAGALTLAAIVGKQMSMLGVVTKGVDRLVVGIGMIPRGEVGLIFANIGLGLHVAGKPIVDQDTFSAVVVMVIVTTMVTPPALKWAFTRKG